MASGVVDLSFNEFASSVFFRKQSGGRRSLATIVSGLGDDPDLNVGLFQNVSGHDSGTVVEGFVVELFVA